MDCTHGYHKQSIHIATRFPRVLESNNNLLKIFSRKDWIGIGISLLLFTTFVTASMEMYKSVQPGNVRQGIDFSNIFIRLVAGFTEPDDEKWFKTFSTGFLILLLTFHYEHWKQNLGRFVMILWSFSFMLMIAIFSIPGKLLMTWSMELSLSW